MMCGFVIKKYTHTPFLTIVRKVEIKCNVRIYGAEIYCLHV